MGLTREVCGILCHSCKRKAQGSHFNLERLGGKESLGRDWLGGSTAELKDRSSFLGRSGRPAQRKQVLFKPKESFMSFWGTVT